MPINLKGRSLLDLEYLSAEEIRYLLRLAAELKAAKLSGAERQMLRGKNIALIFEKDSTRTRAGFEVAAFDQGAHVTYLGPSGSHIGHKESIRDTARVLGRMYDAIEYRGFKQQDVEELARHAGVPVYNGLTDQSHPTQILADMMTMREYTHKHLSDIVTVFMGDTRNNVARSLALGAAKVGMHMRLCGPISLKPDAEFVSHLESINAQSGGSLMVTDNPRSGVDEVDFVYTDVWVSMGEDEALWAERIKLLKLYQVTSDLMRQTGNTHAKFMHCLPAFHNAETEIGKHAAEKFGISAMEVTDDVFESAASIVFAQAENRMHSIKAVLVATLGS